MTWTCLSAEVAAEFANVRWAAEYEQAVARDLFVRRDQERIANRDATKAKNNHALGLCRCGRPLMRGHRVCYVCVTRSRDQHAANLAAGKCSCGRERVPGKSQCAGCAAVNARATLRRRDRLVAEGRCAVCGGTEGMEGFKRCAACRAKLRARQAALYQRRKLERERAAS